MNENLDKQMDERLDALLRGLPDKPVASNFTARVMQATDGETAVHFNWRVLEIFERGNQMRSHAPGWRLWSLPRWLPRFAVPALVLAFTLVAFQHHQAVARGQMAESVAAVSQVSLLPSPAVLKDFEAVRRLSQTPPADEELLALLK